MKRVSGFSLVELLVTMALLSMIVLVGSSAFGLFAKRWDGQLGNFDESMIHARNTMLVHEVMDSLIPYMAYNSKDQPTIYFEGNRNGFVAVSNRSVYVDNVLAVVRLSVHQNPDLTFDVWYEEWPMVDGLLQSAQQNIPFYPPVILFRSVKEPRFSYFGWIDRVAKFGNGEAINPKPAEWLDSANAISSAISPLMARLSFNSSKGRYDMLAFVGKEPIRLLSRYSGARSRRANQNYDQKDGQDEDTSCYC